MVDQWSAYDGNDKWSLTAVSNVDGVTIVRLWADPVTHRLLVDSSGGSSGFTKLTPTGTVNGVNAVFVFTQAPTYIVSDHATYQVTNSIGTTNWTGTTTVTMTIPPTEDIFGWV